jgi:hypothetical protein
MGKLETIKDNVQAWNSQTMPNLLRGAASNGHLNETIFRANSFLTTWSDRVFAHKDAINESYLDPLLDFSSQLNAIHNIHPTNTMAELQARVNEFILKSPLVAVGVYEASHILNLSKESYASFMEATAKELNSYEAQMKANIETLAKEKVEQLQRTSVEMALGEAEGQFGRAALWGYVIAGLCLLVALLIGVETGRTVHSFIQTPPPLIQHIVDVLDGKTDKPNRAQDVPLPLLVMAGLYFTTLRVALLGLLSVGLAFVIKLVRAYLNMAERNSHRLRVTRSMKVFIAAIRDHSQQDLVLGQLIQSVVEFGDPGIISKDSEAGSFQSIVFDPVMKSMSKSAEKQ